VYTRTGSTWTQQGPPLLGGEEQGASTHFGRSVALSADGSTALVAASADRGHRGSVWAFARTDSTWKQRGAKLTGAEEKGEGYFGAGLAVSGDGSTALIGGPGDAGFHGSAWVFVRSASTWSQQGAKLTGSDAVGPARFGRAVALSGNGSRALIGGFGDNERTGAAWVFDRSGATWTQQGGKLTGAGEAGEGHFGRSVSLSADGARALIGAPNDNAKRGAAWTFTGSGSTWTETQKLRARDEAGKAAFASAATLAASGEVALIGGPNDAREFGAAWIFTDRAQGEEPPPEEPPHEEEVHKKRKEPPPSSTGLDGFTLAALLGSSSGAKGGVLAAGPSPSCRLSALDRTIAVQSRGRAAVRLLARGSGLCRGKLALSVKSKSRSRRAKPKTIASATFAIATGKVARVAVKLNSAGQAMLRGGHGRLDAGLTLVRLSPGPAQARIASVRLTLQRPRRLQPAHK
jgi:hypothetical protein